MTFQAPPETLDPQRIVFLTDWEAASFIYEGLAGYGDKVTELRPLLAESWRESEGGKRWLFKLRDNIYFHDDPCFPEGRGRKVAAKDVLYTFERIAKSETACANWYLLSGKIEGIDDFHQGRASTISGITALDERTVEFRLTKSYATFLKILASPTTYIVPREGVEFYKTNFGNLPVGTGPFRLVRWKPLEQLLLARNDRYWRTDLEGNRLPYLDSIDIRYKADATETIMLTEFLKGESYLFSAQEKLYNTLKADLGSEQYRLVGMVPSSSLRFLGFSLDSSSAFARFVELRRAAAMILDRRQLATITPQVSIILAETLVPRYFLNQSLSGHPFDPEAARAIFAQHRRELAESSPILASNFQSGDLMLLQEALTRISAKSTLRIRPANYYRYIVEERPTIFRVSFTPSFFDPEDYYCLFYSKSSNDINLTGYRNVDYDRTLEAAMIELDAAKRTDLFQNLEKILHRDVPAIYLTHGTPTHMIAASFVHGLTIRFLLPDFTETWFSRRGEGGSRPEK